MIALASCDHPVLYLASTSPRRRILLSSAGIDHLVIAPGPEPVGAGTPRERAAGRARAKAVVAPDAMPVLGEPVLILAADTVVALDGQEFGKPGHRAEAATMLRALSGREHSVFTAICLRRVDASADTAAPDAEWRDLAVARVRCDPLTRAQLEAYLDSGEWQGKAGAYGIQGEAAQFMHLCAGALDTVIGLPIDLLRRLLAVAGKDPERGDECA